MAGNEIAETLTNLVIVTISVRIGILNKGFLMFLKRFLRI